MAWIDESRLAIGTADGQIIVRDSDSGDVLRSSLAHETGAVNSLSLSTDRRRLASGGEDGTIRLWNPESGQQLGEPLTGHGDWVQSVAFSPDGHRLASGGAETVLLWDAATGKRVMEPLTGHGGWVASVAFSPDGRRLASGGGSTIRLWDPESGQQLGKYARHGGPVASVAFSPDGRRLASGGDFTFIYLWNSASGEELGEAIQLMGQRDPVFSVAFSPDGRRLASADHAGSIRLWDPESGEPLSEPLTDHRDRVQEVAFSPDAHWLASADEDRTNRRRQQASREQVDVLRRTAKEQVESPPLREPAVAQAVHQLTDQPVDKADADLLRRSSLAGGLAAQLIEVHRSQPAESFAVQVTGRWGTGKTSLVHLTLNALRDELVQHPELGSWMIPPPDDYFDAWRESQVGPAWWSLLNWIRRAIAPAAHTEWRRWARFRIYEWSRRFWLAGLVVPTLVVVGILALMVGSAVWGGPDGKSLANWAKVAGFFVTAGTLIFALSRWFTWRTPSGARLFQKVNDNPMGDLITHVEWLRSKSPGPLLLVIDDLDRCRASYVVELLEAVQTLLRSRAPPTGAKPNANRRTGQAHPLVIVVAADERWLRTAFETAYADYAAAMQEPGQPLGTLFLAKLFQLQLRIPDLSPASAVAFGRARLGLSPEPEASELADSDVQPSTQAPPLLDEKEALQKADEAKAFEESVGVFSRVADPDAALRLGVAVGRRWANPKLNKGLRHELEEYLRLVDPSPRAVLRFINAYALARISLAPLKPPPATDALARWTAVELRWPLVAERIRKDPAQLERWFQPETKLDPDEPLAAVLGSEPFRTAVFDSTDSLVLTKKTLLRLGVVYT
ncbi:MAG: hypothetical protein L0H73_02520 [Nitrococcus sp.]|nr:hypothetical protein [Nitrococcus sp.]